MKVNSEQRPGVIRHIGEADSKKRQAAMTAIGVVDLEELQHNLLRDF